MFYYLQTYRLLKFVAPETYWVLYAQVVILPIFVIYDIAKDSIGFI